MRLVILLLALSSVSLAQAGTLIIRGTIGGIPSGTTSATVSITGPSASVATQCVNNTGGWNAVYNPVTINGSTASNVTVIGGIHPGSFCFAGIANGGTYTLTASLANYTFNPPSVSFTMQNVDQILYSILMGFTSTQVQPYFGVSVVGYIGGPPIPAGVQLTFTGTSEQTSTITQLGTCSGTYPDTTGILPNAGKPCGQYVFQPGGRLPNGYYEVTPSMSGYVFSPDKQRAVINNQLLNYGWGSANGFQMAKIGDNPTHIISGSVMGGTSSPVTITLTGTDPLNSAASATTTTDSNGNYSFSNKPSGPYTLSASLANYTFGPPSQSITVTNFDSLANTFVAFPPTPAPQPTPPTITNAMVNGGFEYGSQCYKFTDQTPTVAGQPGSYQPFVTNDSHSGNYSGAIACRTNINNNCQQAFMRYGAVPIITGKNMQFTGWAKCPMPTTGVPINGNLSAAFTFSGSSPTDVAPPNPGAARLILCDGQWHQNTFTFDMSNASGSMNIGADSITNCGPCAAAGVPLGQTLQIDDMVLTYTDGSGPVANIWRHPGRRNVYVTPDSLYVDGKPYLALAASGIFQKDYAALAAVGGNTIVSFNGTSGPECYNQPTGSIMDLAYDLGLNLVGDLSFGAKMGLITNGVQDPNIGAGGAATIGTYARQYGQHLAHISWFVDEPDLNAFPWYVIPAPTFVQFGTNLRNNTHLPLITDFQQGRAPFSKSILPYNGSTTIWSTEPYSTLFQATAQGMENANLVQKRPNWIYIASPASSEGTDTPYFWHVQKVYYAIVTGLTGIIYFTWDTIANATGGGCTVPVPPATATPCTYTGPDTAMLNAMNQVFTELAVLKDPIALGTPLSGFKAVGGPAALAKQYNGQTFILAVTPVPGPPWNATFTVPGLVAGTPVTVQFENRTITSAAGSFTDTFNGVSGIERHVYVIGTAANAPAKLNVGRIGP